LNPKFKIN